MRKSAAPVPRRLPVSATNVENEKARLRNRAGAKAPAVRSGPSSAQLFDYALNLSNDRHGVKDYFPIL
jgi:hypothetical protein